MNRDQLIERLNAFEWNDIEFKEAQRDVSRDSYKTVSAFSNTSGGHLVFGIRHNNGNHEIVGVIEVDKVQNDFLSGIRSSDKFSKIIDAKESVIRDGDSVILVFYIPEANRHEKPVYLQGDIRQSYIRRGGGDEKCRPEEIEAFLRDASHDRYDCALTNADPESFFDEESLAWYRRQFNDRNPGDETSGLSNTEFLHHWGLLNEDGHQLRPTHAAVFLFGTDAVIRQCLPRAVVDAQWNATSWGDSLVEDERWIDRVVIEENLINTWRRLFQKFIEHSQSKFHIDPASLRRDDLPPDYLAFREAAINLLMHQDFADHNRKPLIQFFKDRTVLSNPGDLFADQDELLEPVEKPVRNPRIVATFRRIGLSENAGTGFRTMYRACDRLGWVPPFLENDKAKKTFALHLLKEPLISEEQLLFQASLGVSLSDSEAKAFAQLCRVGEIRVRDVRAVTGLSSQESQAVIDRLLLQVLVEPKVQGNRSHVQLSEHLRNQLSGAVLSSETPEKPDCDQPGELKERLVTDQPVTNLEASKSSGKPPLLRLTEPQRQIVKMCDVYRSLSDLMGQLGITHRTFFRRTHLEPLLKNGVLKMRYPDTPNHPEQAYTLTPTGVSLADMIAKEKENDIDDDPKRDVLE